MKPREMLKNETILIASIIMLCGLIGGGAGLYKYYPERLGLRAREVPEAATQNAAISTKEKATQDELNALEKHLETKPEHPPILFRIAQLKRDEGKLDEAAGLLRNILKQEPDNIDAHLELGRVLYEKGDAAGALEQTKLILKKNPKHPDALYNLGAIYANINNLALAREYWTKAVASDPASESGKNANQGLQQLAGQTAAPAASVAAHAASFNSSIRIPRAEDFKR